ncbi:MAG: hypothetical protein ABFD92_16015 [Planctomycetaceae bacterium]|nr:hypothetical protein [Planctomycetaceae bacterium]
MADNNHKGSGSMGETPMPQSKSMGETPMPLTGETPLLRDGVPRTTPLSVSPNVTRRGFFGILARVAAAAGLAAGGAALSLLRKGGEGPLKNQSCTSRGLCRGCGAFQTCALPAAMSAKQAGVKP